MNNICIKPILKCHYSCPTCIERIDLHNNIRNDKTYIPMSINEWEKVFADLKSLCNNCNITISGGEPLLYSNLIEMTTIASKYSNYITININANLLNQKLAKELLDIGVKQFNISFMDINANNYIESRGLNNKQIYNTTKNNILYLNKIIKQYDNIISNNIIVLTKKRLLNLDKIILMTKIMNFTHISIDFLEGINIDNNYNIDNIDINIFINNIIANISNNYKKYMYNIVDIIQKPNYRDSSNCECNVPGNFCIILANGDVHQCNVVEYSHEQPIGNVRNKSLIDINNSHEMKEFIKNKSPYCIKCPINYEVRFKI